VSRRWSRYPAEKDPPPDGVLFWWCEEEPLVVVRELESGRAIESGVGCSWRVE
jgi:hypothetical protein